MAAALAQELSKLSISGTSSLEALTAAASKGPAAEIHLISHLPAVLKATADKASARGCPRRRLGPPAALPPPCFGFRARIRGYAAPRKARGGSRRHALARQLAAWPLSSGFCCGCFEQPMFESLRSSPAGRLTAATTAARP